jgi:pimeloyl-ACP methyl ester carboxylesterase
MRHARPIVLCLAVLAGCTGIHAHRKPERIAARYWAEWEQACRGERDPAGVARALESTLGENCNGESLALLADMCQRAGYRSTGDESRTWHRDAAVYSAFALAAAGDEATFQHAQEVHNRSVEQLVRLSHDRLIRRGRTWQQTFDDLCVKLDGTPFLSPQRFTELFVTHDYHISGLQAEYRNGGVGVPLVAFRENERDNPVGPLDRFLSYDVHVAATAVLHPCGTPLDWREHGSVLVLHDPFEGLTVSLAGRTVEMASDRTTPIAVQEQFSSLEVLRRVGVFRPDRVMRSERGLYMSQPYRPGKIPIVLVHGIYSSPSTWAQTVNHLQNDPEIAARYQVWLFLYPSGAPITASAADLRNALREAIDFFDPEGTDPALEQMIVLGHSMGGIMTKMLAMDSGDELWRAYFDRPFDEVQARPEIKARLEETLFLTQEPYVRRLVLVATPHRGSVEACFLPGQLLMIAIRRPRELRDTIRELVRENGRDVAAPGVRARPLNGVGGLSPKDPALAALRRLPILVPYHSVIPQIVVFGRMLPTDGVVGYRSSHIEGAASETILRGFHTSHDSWQVTQEIMRICREHLAEIDGCAKP